MNEALHTWTVEPSQAGVRLDRWLAQALPSQSRSRLQALVAEGHVSLDGKAVTDPSRKVKGGEHVALVVPEAAPARPQPEAIPLVVVFEDADLIVVDKPAGMVVHPAPGSGSATLVNALLHHCG